MVIREGDRLGDVGPQLGEQGEESLGIADAGIGDDARAAADPRDVALRAGLRAEHGAREVLLEAPGAYRPIWPIGRRRTIDDDGIYDAELKLERRTQRAGRDHLAIADPTPRIDDRHRQVLGQLRVLEA